MNQLEQVLEELKRLRTEVVSRREDLPQNGRHMYEWTILGGEINGLDDAIAVVTEHLELLAGRVE